MICSYCGLAIGPDEEFERLEPHAPTGPTAAPTLHVHRACILRALAAAASDPRVPRRP
ncbi:hypothetical protein OIE43_18745 [Streptomyces pseudovenezuelae]|uniref:hypothetical protein n=1 Tax=Streptomyces pseudovenezuelae TaxID=67350 RepID=UPI002E3547B3|nr:hypothetical protein [Streptomyces pseudovenezuelae]